MWFIPESHAVYFSSSTHGFSAATAFLDGLPPLLRVEIFCINEEFDRIGDFESFCPSLVQDARMNVRTSSYYNVIIMHSLMCSCQSVHLQYAQIKTALLLSPVYLTHVKGMIYQQPSVSTQLWCHLAAYPVDESCSLSEVQDMIIQFSCRPPHKFFLLRTWV